MKYWNSKLKNMTEYVPGEQPANIDEYIKLNTNENPFPPAPSALEAMRKACNEKIRLYPDPESTKLRETFARQNNINPGNIFAGNGSDEIFSLIFRGFIEPDGLAAFPYPSYSLYYTMAEANGISYQKINSDEKFNLDLDMFLKKKYDLVILCNPNNPTGKGLDINKTASFLEKFKGLAVIDEAYVDFYGESAIRLAAKFSNLIVTRSFSKSYSLAGLRVGLAIANEEIIRGFFKLKDSYNVDRIAEAGAVAAMLDTKNFDYNLRMTINNKEYMEEYLAAMGFEIIPSKANFILVRHPKIKSAEIYEQLKEKRILVRHFNTPVICDYIRISVGTMMDIKKLLKELEEILTV